MSPTDFMLASVVMLTWGFNFVVVKVGISELPPLLLTGLRFALIAILLAPFFRPERRQLPLILLLSFTMGTLHFGLLLVGMRGMDAATAAIAIQLQVPFSALLAAFYFRERLGRRRAAGILVAFSGTMLLFGEPSLPEPWALGLVLVSALGFALSTVVIKFLGQAHPLAMNGTMALFGAPQLLLFSFLFESGQVAAMEAAGWRGWGAVLFTAFGASVLAHSLWYILVRRNEMNQIVPFSLLAPVIGIFAGILILGEPFTWHKAVGGGLTILGVLLVQFAGARSPARFYGKKEGEA